MGARMLALLLGQSTAPTQKLTSWRVDSLGSERIPPLRPRLLLQLLLLLQGACAFCGCCGLLPSLDAVGRRRPHGWLCHGPSTPVQFCLFFGVLHWVALCPV